MKFSTVAAAALSASIASAMTDEQVQEINAIVKDISANQAQYIGLEVSPPAGFTMPTELIQLYAKVMTYKDESYTTLLADLDYDALINTITYFSWYSDRLVPALESVRKEYNTEAAATTTKAAETTTKAAATSKAAAETSKAAETTTEAAETTTTKAAETSKAAETTTTKAASSKAAETTTKAASSKAAETTTKAKATTQAVSQIDDGQIQQTASIKTQTENGAAKAVAGMGAGAVAIAALLL